MDESRIIFCENFLSQNESELSANIQKAVEDFLAVALKNGEISDDMRNLLPLE